MVILLKQQREQWTIEVANLTETEQIASTLADLAWAGMFIALDGDLGAGKTAFSKAFARAIGVQEVVSSPTFTIIKEYQGAVYPFYHMDVYRVSLEEADELGLDDYFFGEGITIVEWASIIEELLPEQSLSIYIEYIDEHCRRIHLKARGERYINCLNEIIDRSL